MPKKIKLSKLTFTIDDDDSLSKKAISAIVTKFNGKISPRLSKTTNFLITTKNQIKKNKRNVQKASKLKIKCIPVEALFMNNLMKQKQNDNFWEKDNNNVIRLYNGAESCFLKLNKNELTIQNKIKKKIIRKKLKFPNENLAEKSLFKNILECAKNNFCTFKPKKKIFEKSKSVDFKFDRKTSTQKSESVPKFFFKNYKKSPKQYEFMRQSEFKSEIAVNSKRKIDFYSPLFQIEF
ncbi:hypothetical protein MHBO_000822 [Bonamia ostreae]|uniref:BRCT domain-containing protein n=1 Tax=Bonamia ostreae TaxID=126728 RepID=A0ABV2AGY2_9EUKA